MSIIGSFANKVFKVSSNHLYTFDEFTMSGELKVDEQEVDNSKPSSYIKGPGLDKVSLNILLIYLYISSYLYYFSLKKS